MIYLLVLLSGMLVVGFVQLRWVFARRRLLSRSWEEVLEAVEHVDFTGVRTVAQCYLQPDKDQLRVEPDEMWALLGGLEGINRMQKNASAMLDLAVYAERWNDTEGPIIAEMIRRDAARLQSAVTRIQLTFFLGFGFVKTPFHVQEAAATYYLMRSRLLGLYENGHAALVPRLAEAL